MNLLVCGALLAAAVFHLLPALGALGSARLTALYGVAIEDEHVLLLMRHRALMFAVLGGLMLAAVFVPALRVPMLGAALVSTLAFVLLARTASLNPQLRRVFWIDVVLATLLAVSLIGSALAA